ncbi:MAG: Gfo/Idh/MocA family oxidoreductase [Kiritimatiellae bacterium]|nr:Gfo/Idh/MocA family oxidoreductase [Kiritimatiellia bacterium]
MKRFKRAADIKVAVVGYGGAFNMGRLHLNEMKRAGMTPAAVAELDPKRLEAAKQDFPGIATFRSTGELLTKSDAHLITIITPHNTHAKLALQCLRAGRNVVCEKPMAITTAECDAMIAEARRRKVLVSTYHNRHWDGHIVEALKRIKNEREPLGELVRVECRMGGWSKPGDWWRSSKSISGGILYDWGVHLLEYALQVIADDMVEISGYAHSGFWGAQTRWGARDGIEDEATAVVRFKRGCMLTLRISNIESNPKPGVVEFTGTRGTYVMNFPDFEMITHAKGGETVKTVGRNPEGEWWRFYQNIADHLTQGAELTITGEWARRPIHIIDMAFKSAKAGRALPVRHR